MVGCSRNGLNKISLGTREGNQRSIYSFNTSGNQRIIYLFINNSKLFSFSPKQFYHINPNFL